MNSETEELRGRPTAYANKPVTLECPMSGNPLPQITWMKNGKEINLDEEPNIYIHGDGQILSLMRAKNEDTGKYICIAENDVGSEAYQFDLEILAAPTIDKKNIKSTYYVKEGNSIVIKCPVSGHPKPIITWLKDSDVIPLQSSSHITFSEGFQHLHLKHASLRDAGKYSCIAGNEVGTAEQDFKIDVQVPPKLENLLDVPENKSAILNKPAIISCPVSGIPPPLVKWYKDDKPLRAESDPNIMLSINSKHLKIFRTQISDAGTYTCKAANDVGKIEKDFKLNIQVPPSMLETNSVLDYYAEDEDEVKSELKAVENDTMQIECYVDGNPKPIILWIKDGYLLNTSSDSHYEIFHNSQVLQINQVLPSDAGHYTCVASNVAGTKEKSFMLDVHVPPKLKGSNFEEQEVLPNRPTAIECFVDSNPPPTITWYKNDKIINFADHALIKVIEDGKVLQFLKTTPEDGGDYTCIAENSVGKTEKSFKVDVFVPPIIENVSFKSDVLENEELTMECRASGNPSTICHLVERCDSILKVNEAKRFHSGQYKCIVSNAAGSVEKSFDVYVKVPPRVVNTSEPNKTVFVNQPISLHCFVEAEPEASITWVKDGHILNDMIDPFIHILDDGQKLQIFRTRDSDEGQYSCEVSNSVGNDSRSFILNILVPPNIYDESADYIGQMNQQMKLHCLTGGNPKPVITWMKNGQFIDSFLDPNIQLNENKSVLIIRWTRTEDAGKYTCIASNAAGQDEKNFNVHVHNGKILKIISAKEDDAGKYNCISSNDAGSDEAEFTLEVMIPPLMKASAVAFEQKSREGDNILLECPIEESNYATKISWKKNGKLFRPTFAPAHVEFSPDNKKIKVMKSQVADSGIYSCIASNSAGDTEHEIDLLVKAAAKIIYPSENRTSTYVKEHHTITLDCTVTGYPQPVIKWFKNGSLISLQQNTSFATYGKMKISKASANDSGLYTCVAENDGDVDTKFYNLTVYKISLDCLASGIPPPRVIWYKGSQMLIPGPRVSLINEGASLKISHTLPSDAGKYTCLAVNEAGDTEAEHFVKIHVSPKVEKVSLQGSSDPIVNQSVRIICNVQGLPFPQMMWYKNGILIDQNEKRFSYSGGEDI
ncbi:hemicentin-1 [Caerostris extrusa]|uniref:Hemicentin-1 n=1 Tax=Caerostris extrusa TaxID=172846 RepID=A0AAV4RVZ0_CAEEX|nr:hemicentin-1 [Caerostris extrusa]